MEANRDRWSEADLGQSIKKCTTERGPWQLGQRGGVRACHEMLMCELGVSNTKTSQDYLSVSGPMCGGTPSIDGGLNQGQLTSGVPANIPAKDRGLEEGGIRYLKKEKD